MTGEQDTGNPERLPLAERARRGLLAGESELYIHEIAELEYPNLTDKTERDSFERLLHGLAIHGLFPGCSMRILERSEYRLCPVKNRVTIVAWSVPREPYRTWRATQSNPPAGSIIHLWLGTIPTPANLPQSKPASPPQSESDRPEQGAAKSQKSKHKRVDALGEAIKAALEVLSHDGRFPTPAALFEYLLNQDKTGVVIPGDSKTVFYWYASNGNKQSADISIIAKRLGRMKQSN